MTDDNLNLFISKIMSNDLNQMVESSSTSEICFDVLGIIITAKMTDVLEETFARLNQDVSKLKNAGAICDYIFTIVESFCNSCEESEEWLRILVDQSMSAIGKCQLNLSSLTSMLIRLGDVKCIAEFMEKLSHEEALQMAVDLVDNCPPSLIKELRDQIKHPMLVKILSGDLHTKLRLLFLVSNNKSDLKTLKHIKETARYPITTNAITIANGFINLGTGNDIFLRENLDWLARFVCWPCFSASASLGQIHRVILHYNFISFLFRVLFYPFYYAIHSVPKCKDQIKCFIS